jgi:hypothetical protein
MSRIEIGIALAKARRDLEAARGRNDEAGFAEAAERVERLSDLYYDC